MYRFELRFNGFWLGLDSIQVPDEPGIYCIYAADFDLLSGRIAPLRLLYVGETLSGRQKALEHERRQDFSELLSRGERLCYSFAPILFGREQARAALIYRHRPPGNQRFRHHFPYPETEVRLEGEIACLQPLIVAPDPACTLVRGSEPEVEIEALRAA